MESGGQTWVSTDSSQSAAGLVPSGGPTRELVPHLSQHREAPAFLGSWPHPSSARDQQRSTSQPLSASSTPISILQGPLGPSRTISISLLNPICKVLFSSEVTYLQVLVIQTWRSWGESCHHSTGHHCESIFQAFCLELHISGNTKCSPTSES